MALKMSNWEMGGNSKSSLCSFNYTSTVYMEMNCAGTVFGNRCTYLQNLVGWGFGSSSVLLNVLSVSE